MKAVKAHSIYFLGIGGIGMSALARYFHKMGKKIHGYDLTPTPLTRQLEQEGMQIHYQEDAALIPSETDFVIYTPAIPPDNKELVYLTNKGIPIYKRAEVIGQLTDQYFTIAVAGTHGKTSICAIATHLLHTSNKKITALVGGIMKNYDSNLLASNPTEILLVEADEYDRSFLKINPDIAVVSSMDADHLDIYGDVNEMEKNFRQFVDQIDVEGLLIYNEKLEPFHATSSRKISYGFHSSSGLYAKNIRVESGRFHFDLLSDGMKISDIQMIIPGRHYIENALAASAIAIELGLEASDIKKGLESFEGVERRFDLRFENDKVVFIDDYAHHPEEIEATVNAVKELYPERKITGVFQPHLFSRTRDHADGFARSLKELDEVILLDIYPAREKPLPGVSSHIIFEKLSNKNKIMLSKEDLLSHLEKTDIETLLTIGAGDIGLMTDDMDSILRRK